MHAECIYHFLTIETLLQGPSTQRVVTFRLYKAYFKAFFSRSIDDSDRYPKLRHFALMPKIILAPWHKLTLTLNFFFFFFAVMAMKM